MCTLLAKESPWFSDATPAAVLLFWASCLFSPPCWPADGHVGLLDYGQSKQLPLRDKLALATLIIALTDGDTLSISEALTRLGVATTKEDPKVRAEMAVGMFDTLGR